MAEFIPRFIVNAMGINPIFDIFILVVGIFVLMWAAETLVSSLHKIAHYLKLSNYIIAFILMGFATNLPELFLGVISAFNKVPIYSLGNIFGSNLANIGLVLGIGVLLIKGLKIKKKVAKEDAIYMLIVSLFSVVLIFDGVLSRTDGFILLGIFVFYLIKIFYHSNHPTIEKRRILKSSFLASIVLFFVGIYLLILSSQVIVISGISISKNMGFPLILLGIFSAVGTVLPELSFTIKSVFKYNGEMALGNILGGIIIKSSLMLGIVAIIHPIFITNISLVVLSASFMIISLALFIVFSRTDEELSFKEGLILFGLYILFLFLATLLGR